jgi:DNA (cytosine-5)-methyltransferase 1
MSSPNFIEVCAGCGGLSLGLIKSGFTPIFLNEIDETCCETLKKNHSEANILNKSMNEIDWKLYKNKVDLLCGGIPCQSFSIAGKRKGLKDERGNLMLDFAKIVNVVLPKVFFIENVKGLISHDKGKTLKSIIKSINVKNKYTISYKVLNAYDYEVPQKRERVFIIGTRKDLNLNYIFPNPRKKKLILRDVLKSVPKSVGMTYPQHKRNIMKQIPQGGCWVNLPLEVQKEYLGKSYYSGGGKRGIARRLSMDEPCLTLTTSPCQKQTERCHPLYTRPLTTREYARIQTFPDEYKFSGSMAKIYKQIGNAVPCRLAYFVGKSIKEILS